MGQLVSQKTDAGEVVPDDHCKQYPEPGRRTKAQNDIAQRNEGEMRQHDNELLGRGRKSLGRELSSDFANVVAMLDLSHFAEYAKRE